MPNLDTRRGHPSALLSKSALPDGSTRQVATEDLGPMGLRGRAQLLRQGQVASILLWQPSVPVRPPLNGPPVRPQPDIMQVAQDSEYPPNGQHHAVNSDPERDGWVIS